MVDRLTIAERYASSWPKLVGWFCTRGLDQAQAEDLAQAVWEKLLRAARRGATITWPYVWKAARNALIDVQRRAGREVSLELVPEWDGAASPLEELIRRERVAELMAALGGPESRARRVVQMRADGYRHAEIAAELGISRGALKQALERAAAVARRTVSVGAELGVNVDGAAASQPGELAEAGSRWVRVVALPDLDIRPWLKAIRARGIKVLLAICHESMLSDGQWHDSLELHLKRYDAYVDAWQIGNEPDGTGPSSWTMTQATLNVLLMAARTVLGPDRTIVSPGFCSGQPSWLDSVRLDLVDRVAFHPYGKHPTIRGWGTGYLPNLTAGYQAYGKPLWVTEFGYQTKGPGAMSEVDQATYYGTVLEYLKLSPIEVGLVFCWEDDMVAGFGLLDHGRRKPSFTAFQRAAGGPLATNVAISPAPAQLEIGDGFRAMLAAAPNILGAPLTSERWPKRGISSLPTTQGVCTWADVKETGSVLMFTNHSGDQWLFEDGQLRRVA